MLTPVEIKVRMHRKSYQQTFFSSYTLYLSLPLSPPPNHYHHRCRRLPRHSFLTYIQVLLSDLKEDPVAFTSRSPYAKSPTRCLSNT